MSPSQKKSAKRAKSAESLLLMCRLGDPRRFGQSGDKRDDISASALRLANVSSVIQRPCHLAWSGHRLVSVMWCFQVVKTAQSRGRTERTLVTRCFLLSAGGPPGGRNAADRRNPSTSISHYRLLHPSHHADNRFSEDALFEVSSKAAAKSFVLSRWSNFLFSRPPKLIRLAEA